MKSILVALLLSVGIVAVTPSGFAKTPDSKTPAEEAICDPLKADGTTKGLYGLCVAFCEAQDHADIGDPITEEDLIALAESAPSGRILESYNKKKSDEDPNMPCVLVQEDEACPCWTPAEVASIDGALPTGEDLRAACEIYDRPGSFFLYERSSINNTDDIQIARSYSTSCFYSNNQGSSDILRTFSPITATQTAECYAQVEEQANRANIDCTRY